MEKFVLRGDEAVALRTQQSAITSGSDRQRLRQTTIADGSKVVVEEAVVYLRDELDDAKTTTNMLSILDALEKHYISLEMLEKTRIGVSLSRLQRRAESGTMATLCIASLKYWYGGGACSDDTDGDAFVDEVRDRVTLLLKIWKARAKKAMRRRTKRVQTYGRNFAE